jgi:tetratricopeptide (TPR) repeat protein
MFQSWALVVAFSLPSQAVVPASDGQCEEMLQAAGEQFQKGDLAGAKKTLSGVLSYARRHRLLDPGRYAAVLNNLGSVYLEQERYVDAEKYHRLAVEAWDEVRGAEAGLAKAQVNNNLATLALRSGKLSRAVSLYRGVLDQRAAALGPSHPDVAEIWINLGHAYREQGKYIEAHNALDNALRIHQQYEKANGIMHADMPRCINNLAMLLVDMRRQADARLLLVRAVESWERIHGRCHPALAVGLQNLGALHLKQGDYEAAGSALSRALEIAERVYGPDHSRVAAILYHYGEVLRKTGRKKDAKQMKARAESIMAAFAYRNDFGHTVDISAFDRASK